MLEFNTNMFLFKEWKVTCKDASETRLLEAPDGILPPLNQLTALCLPLQTSTKLVVLILFLWGLVFSNLA